MDIISYNREQSSNGFEQILTEIKTHNHSSIFITWMDFTGKSTLATDLASQLNGAGDKHKKIALYYQSQIAKDFSISADDKDSLQKKQQEVMTQKYDEEIKKDNQRAEPYVIYDRNLLDLIWPWSSTTEKKLEDFEEMIIWYLKHYPNFIYVIVGSSKETILERAEGRESHSESDRKLIEDIKNNGGKSVYEENVRKNKEFGEFIQKLIADKKIDWKILFVDTSK